MYASDGVTPVSGATVGLYATTNTTAPVATTITAADGSYQFTGIAPDTYKLHVSADPSRYLPQWYFNSTDPEGASAIDIGPGTHNTGWNVISSDATTSLDGVVYAPDDVTPISGATVGLYSASDTNTPVATTATAADGSYHFAGMAPDTYKLHVSPTPPATYRSGTSTPRPRRRIRDRHRSRQPRHRMEFPTRPTPRCRSAAMFSTKVSARR